MSFLEGLTLVGVTIFAVIVRIFSVWNGCMTRREIIKAITEAEKDVTKAITETAEKISQLIVANGEKTRELLKPK